MCHEHPCVTRYQTAMFLTVASPIQQVFITQSSFFTDWLVDAYMWIRVRIIKKILFPSIARGKE